MTETAFLLTVLIQYQALTSDENKEKYQLGHYKLIQSQILQTYITRTEWQTVRRITNEILGVKGSSNDRCKRCERLFAKNVSSMFFSRLNRKMSIFQSGAQFVKVATFTANVGIRPLHIIMYHKTHFFFLFF